MDCKNEGRWEAAGKPWWKNGLSREFQMIISGIKNRDLFFSPTPLLYPTLPDGYISF
jgi:hypothetical protein